MFPLTKVMKSCECLEDVNSKISSSQGTNRNINRVIIIISIAYLGLDLQVITPVCSQGL